MNHTMPRPDHGLTDGRFKTKQAEIDALRRRIVEFEVWRKRFERRERRQGKLWSMYCSLKKDMAFRVEAKAEKIADRKIAAFEAIESEKATAVLDWIETGRFNGKPIQDMTLLRMELER